MIDYKELRLNIIVIVAVGLFSALVGCLLYNSALNPSHQAVEIEENMELPEMGLAK